MLFDRIAMVHVHGHASREELKMMLSLTTPQFFVPVHGEYHHLVAHKGLAQSMGVPDPNIFVLEDGDVLELTRDGGKVVDKVPAGHVYVDGHSIIDSKSSILRDRRALSRDGVLMVTIALDKDAGTLAKPPQVTSKGFMEQEDVSELFRKVSESLVDSFDHTSQYPIEPSTIDAMIKDTVGKLLLKETGRRPTIMTSTLEV